MNAMVPVWRLTKNDTILNVLPLHHVHGMINCVMLPLYIGGTVVMMNKFDAKQVLKIIYLLENILKTRSITILKVESMIYESKARIKQFSSDLTLEI